MTDILFEYDHILIRSEYKTPELHAHLASHLIVCLDGKMQCTVCGEDFSAEGLFIASDKTHTVHAPKGEMLLYLFDAASTASKIIERDYLCGKDFCILDGIYRDGESTVQKIRNIWNEYGKDSASSADRKILEAMNLNLAATTPTDERIKRVLEYLSSLNAIPGDIMKKLCDISCLSQSRLSHLFTQNMGMSLHRYLSFDKMRKGYTNFLSTGNITQAALDSGFDTPSHFAATCKRMFGLSFSEFQKSTQK